jgi:hypothetical protein
LEFIAQVEAREFFALARELAALSGKIISTFPVLGNIARLMTRHCSMSVNSASQWDSRFKLDAYSIRELEF